MVTLVRQERAQVLVTYDENGFYGHPDHIKAHQITAAEYEAAGDAARWPEAGEPWRPAKLYYTAVARSEIKNFGRLLREAGIEAPFEGGEAREPDIGTPHELITTEIDVSAHVERTRRALMAHASQMGPEVFFAKLPPGLFYRGFNGESFQLARGPPESRSMAPVGREISTARGRLVPPQGA